MTRFTNKVALITGGGTGIGRAVARALVAEGARVVVTGRREEPLRSLSLEHPESVKYIRADVVVAEEVARAVDFTVGELGRLDVLINNAGVGIFKPLSDTSESDLIQLTEVNFNGVIHAIRAALPHLIENRGSIVNISSTLASSSSPGTSVYSATKAAVERLTRSLAVELGPSGVRVNAVAPGTTETEMLDEQVKHTFIAQTPLGRLGKPDDIARPVAFLASDDAAWITGQVLASSGGLAA
ncbi:MAG: SDR family oxidoreductase [Proteobacteria bacterium]|nr:SDR family oxidoreductase [Pseudomonadota bacterium]